MIRFAGIFFIFLILILTLKLKINIKHIFIQNTHITYEIDVGVYLLYFIKIFNIKFVKDGIKFLFFHIAYPKIDIPKIDNDLVKEILKNGILKSTNSKLEKFDLRLQFGFENLMLNVLVIPIISTYLSALEMSRYKKINLKNYYYEITPNFPNILFRLYFSSILSISVISLAFFILKSRRKIVFESIK